MADSGGRSDAWQPGLPRNPEEEKIGLHVYLTLQPYSLKDVSELQQMTTQKQLLAQVPNIASMARLAAHSPLNAIVQELGEHSATLWRSDWEPYTALHDIDPETGVEKPLYISRAITVPAEGYPLTFAAGRCGSFKEVKALHQQLEGKKAIAGLVLPYQYLMLTFELRRPDPANKMQIQRDPRGVPRDVLPDFACPVWDCVSAVHRHAFLSKIADRMPLCYDAWAPLVRGWLSQNPDAVNGVREKEAALIKDMKEYELAENARDTFSSKDEFDMDPRMTKRYKKQCTQFDPKYQQAMRHAIELVLTETPTEMKKETLPKEWPREFEIENPRFARGVLKMYLGVRYYEVGEGSGQAPVHGLQCAISSVRFVINDELYQKLYNAE